MFPGYKYVLEIVIRQLVTVECLLLQVGVCVNICKVTDRCGGINKLPARERVEGIITSWMKRSMLAYLLIGAV